MFCTERNWLGDQSRSGCAGRTQLPASSGKTQCKLLFDVQLSYGESPLLPEMQLHFQTLFTQKKSIRSFWFTVLHVGAGPMIPQARGSHGRPADGVSIGGRAAVHSRGATDLEREVNPVDRKSTRLNSSH